MRARATFLRCASILVLALAVTSCLTNHPRHVLPSRPIEELDPATGQRVITYPPMFLLGAISQSTVPVYLHFEGVKLPEGSEVEVYLYEPQWVRTDNNFVGLLPAPSSRGVATMEVRDFAANGRVHAARTVLRGSAGFGLALAVKRGGVSIERVTLTTSPKP